MSFREYIFEYGGLFEVLLLGALVCFGLSLVLWMMTAPDDEAVTEKVTLLFLDAGLILIFLTLFVFSIMGGIYFVQTSGAMGPLFLFSVVLYFVVAGWFLIFFIKKFVKKARTL
jgi:hypothetical protein